VTLVPATPEPESEASLIVDVKAWKSITSLQKPGKEDMLAKILSLFLADSQQLVDKLHQGMAAGDATAVNQAAHSLKGRSAVLGALSLATLCQEFETLSRQGQLKEAEPLLDQLDAAFDHASQIFGTELNKRRAA
jgi:HPt (histidine-containing phosphotransfer) domain-containing protein